MAAAPGLPFTPEELEELSQIAAKEKSYVEIKGPKGPEHYLQISRLEERRETIYARARQRAREAEQQ